MGDGDIVFHFNPRPSERVCIRNTLLGGVWGAEEKWQPYFPFDDGRSFNMKIEVTKDMFKTYVNGRHFVDFSHRSDFQKGKYLILREGAEYYDVIFQDKPVIPYETGIYNGMRVGKTMKVRGMCTDDDGFAINFKASNDDIYFHFNARPREARVVRNSFVGSWGREEKDCPQGFPFYPSQYFDASFVCMEDKFSVFVNNEHYIDFFHRGDPSMISILNIVGSVSLLDVDCLEPVGIDSMTEVESGLEKGDVYMLNAMMKEDGNTFAINFMNGFAMSDDISFHFNPRRQSREVVMNSRFGGAWQVEEKLSLPPVFWTNRPFEVKIETKRNKFVIFVNGVKIGKYRMRGSVDNIRSIQVSGEVLILETRLMKRLEKPIWERLQGGIQAGSWVILQGTPKKNWQNFAINFTCDDREDGDIAFHFNPRRYDRSVVRNHREFSRWGQEETQTPRFPFETGNTFEIVFFVRQEKFVAYVNGQYFIDFNHRLPLERISHLTMVGDCNFYDPEVVV